MQAKLHLAVRPDNRGVPGDRLEVVHPGRGGDVRPLRIVGEDGWGPEALPAGIGRGAPLSLSARGQTLTSKWTL